MLASIREIGMIEPLMVHPQKGVPEAYLLLDGHMRLKALHELNHTDAFCLIARDDDAFTYNDKVNRLSLIQEHAMIMRAIDLGVSPEQIAKALDVDIAKVRASVSLLDGIHREAVDLLKDKPITAAALHCFKKAKPVRQVDMAQLMVASNNFTRGYADALIIGTPSEQLVKGHKAKIPRGLSDEEVVRMEKEMETLERDYRLSQDQFGENSLHLNAAQRYVKRLLENARIRKFLGSRYPEVLEEFQALAALETL
jgi:ParB-like chromosome segregation protein Spo0J